MIEVITEKVPHARADDDVLRAEVGATAGAGEVLALERHDLREHGGTGRPDNIGRRRSRGWPEVFGTDQVGTAKTREDYDGLAGFVAGEAGGIGTEDDGRGGVGCHAATVRTSRQKSTANCAASYGSLAPRSGTFARV